MHDNEFKILQHQGIALPLVSSNILNKLLYVEIFPLCKDDLYFLFTDGLLETIGNNDIVKGMDKLKLLIQNSVLIDTEIIKGKILNYLSQNKFYQNDDISLLISKAK